MRRAGFHPWTVAKNLVRRFSPFLLCLLLINLFLQANAQESLKTATGKGKEKEAASSLAPEKEKETGKNFLKALASSSIIAGEKDGKNKVAPVTRK